MWILSFDGGGERGGGSCLEEFHDYLVDLVAEAKNTLLRHLAAFCGSQCQNNVFILFV